MFSFLSRQAIAPESAEWITECHAWALANFDRRAFETHTRLVTPSKDFFPKRVKSPQEVATYTFERVVELAGVKHWPFKLVAPQDWLGQYQPKQLGLECSQRFVPAVSYSDDEFSLPISYHPEQLKKPEDLTATFAHIIAQHMVIQARELPPGGEDYFLQASEVLACFLGFGVMLANSAYTFRGGCGRCYNPMANREASLSESETVFSLAIFCKLKGIRNGEVFKYLKRYLRSEYKASVKQLAKSDSEIFKPVVTEISDWCHVSGRS